MTGEREDATVRLSPPEGEALRVMVGLAASGADDDDPGARKAQMRKVLWGSETARTPRRVEQIEHRLCSAVEEALVGLEHELPVVATRDRPVFGQFVNPELRAAYGHKTELSDAAVRGALERGTRVALLATTRWVVFPASYVFEVPGFIDFLAREKDSAAEGLVRITGPTPDLEVYRQAKQSEYRDSRSNPYSTQLGGRRLAELGNVVWHPRSSLSSAAVDISRAWRAEVAPDGELAPIIGVVARSQQINVAQAAADLRTVPERLNGRAFIREFVLGTGVVPRRPAVEVRVASFLSQRYVVSYLRDLDANMLIDWPQGMYSVGLEAVTMPDYPRLIRANRVLELVEWLEVRARSSVARRCARSPESRAPRSSRWSSTISSRREHRVDSPVWFDSGHAGRRLPAPCAT